MIKIAIVEDDRKLLSEVTELLDFYDDLTVVATYSCGEDVVKAATTEAADDTPDVYLMDIQLPGISGIDATRAIKAHLPATEVIMLTVYDNDETVFNSIQSGASGYVLKGASPDEIAQAIRDVVDGGSPMSQKVARKVLNFIKDEAPHVSSVNESLSITRREQEILSGLASGETYLSLARKLFISPHTVRTHIKNIYEKLHVHNRALAVKKALENKII